MSKPFISRLGREKESETHRASIPNLSFDSFAIGIVLDEYSLAAIRVVVRRSTVSSEGESYTETAIFVNLSASPVTSFLVEELSTDTSEESVSNQRDEREEREKITNSCFSTSDPVTRSSSYRDRS